MSKGQIIHSIIDAFLWVAFVAELIILDKFDGCAVLVFVLGVLVSAFIIKKFSDEYILVYMFSCFIILTAIAIPTRNINLDTQAKAVELYEQGRYEESMDEFMKIKDTGFVDGYVEEYTVYKLKGTDIEVRVEK